METQTLVVEPEITVLSERGAYRLAGAMLLQAIQDVSSRSAGRRACALRWITRRSGPGYTFDYVCRILNRDPDNVRQLCQRKALERQSSEFLFAGRLN